MTEEQKRKRDLAAEAFAKTGEDIGACEQSFRVGAAWALNGEVVRGMRDALKSGCYCGSSPYGEKDWCECCVALAAFDSAVSEGGE